MYKYYIDLDKDQEGNHKVHREGCKVIPCFTRRKLLGVFPVDILALIEAKKIYSTALICPCCANSGG